MRASYRGVPRHHEHVQGGLARHQADLKLVAGSKFLKGGLCKGLYRGILLGYYVGGYIGEYYRGFVYNGDTRSLDYSHG